MSEREGLPIGLRGTLALSSVLAALGFGIHSAHSWVEYEPNAETVRQASNLDSAADDLELVGLNPIFVKEKVDNVAQTIGNVGNLDDRLNAASKALDNRGLNSPLTQNELLEIEEIRFQLTELVQEKRDQLGNPYRARTALGFTLVGLLPILYGAAAIIKDGMDVESARAEWDYWHG